MKLLYQKIPFLLELFFNGIFIFVYSFFNKGNVGKFGLDLETVNSLLNGFTKAAPIFVIISIVHYYLTSKNVEDFLRKYIFSLVVIVPMLLTYGDLQFTFWLASVHLFSSILSLYDNQASKGKVSLDKTNLSIMEKLKLAPAQIVIITFGGLVLIGAFLLVLPISSVEGRDISIIDAIFTATSATCVTGLSTLSLSDNFSLVGQIIVLTLIQIGGLGFMTLSSSMTILLGKGMGVKSQVIMQDLLDISSLEDLIAMIVDIIKYTIVIEIWGGILLTIGFSLEGLEFGEALYYGFFHSISAFCNAGFALFNNSLETYYDNPLIQGTISVLIVLGGLGFIVIKELENVIFKKKQLVNLTVHSKIVLSTNIILIFAVAAYFFFSEYLHALNGLSLLDQIQVSLFQSITTRTAGFNTISLSSLHPHTLYLFTLIMFIGASPGSTGGGIKTTTFAILFQSVKSTLRGKDRVEFFERTVSSSVVVRSIAIIVISLIIVSFFILLMMRVETEQPFLEIFFEVVSAFATVGLSLGITPYLSLAGKAILVILMFIGRVGPLTLALAIAQRSKEDGNVDFPTGRVMIG